MQEESDEQAPKQGIGLKLTNNAFETQREDSNNEEVETIIMIARGFKMMFQKHPKV